MLPRVQSQVIIWAWTFSHSRFGSPCMHLGWLLMLYLYNHNSPTSSLHKNWIQFFKNWTLQYFHFWLFESHPNHLSQSHWFTAHLLRNPRNEGNTQVCPCILASTLQKVGLRVYSYFMVIRCRPILVCKGNFYHFSIYPESFSPWWFPQDCLQTQEWIWTCPSKLALVRSTDLQTWNRISVFCLP